MWKKVEYFANLFKKRKTINHFYLSISSLCLLYCWALLVIRSTQSTLHYKHMSIVRVTSVSIFIHSYPDWKMTQGVINAVIETNGVTIIISAVYLLQLKWIKIFVSFSALQIYLRFTLKWTFQLMIIIKYNSCPNNLELIVNIITQVTIDLIKLESPTHLENSVNSKLHLQLKRMMFHVQEIECSKYH